MDWHRLVAVVLLVALSFASPARSGETSLAVGERAIPVRLGLDVLSSPRQQRPIVTDQVRSLMYQVIEVDGDWVRIHTAKGLGWLPRKDVYTPAQALTAFTARIKRNPSDAEAWALRGMASFLSKTPDQGLSDFTEAIRLQPTKAEFHHMRSLVWSDRERVLADLAEAARLDASNGQIRCDQASIWDLLGEAEKKRAYLLEALRLDPACADAYCLRAMDWEKARNDEQALADYAKAIELNPGHAVAYRNRALLFKRRGDLDAAIRDLTAELPFGKLPARTYHERAELWIEKGDADKALADIRETLRVYPTFQLAQWTEVKAWNLKSQLAKATEPSTAPLPVAPPIPLIQSPASAATPPKDDGRKLQFKRYISQAGRFEVDLPGPAKEVTAPIPGFDNQVILHVVGSEVSFDLAYMVCYCDCPAEMVALGAERILSDLCDRGKGNGNYVQNVAMTFRDEGYRPGIAVPGRDTLLNIPGGRCHRVRLLVDSGRAYQIRLIGSLENVTSPDADAFMRSFHITNQQGK